MFSVFLPLRKGSERVPDKNIKEILNFSKGLFQIKITQLLGCELIDEIIVSTDYTFSELNFENNILSNKKIKFISRPNFLCKSDTPLKDLILYASQVCNFEFILWTHVTSPFLNSRIYDKIIESFKNSNNDSLITTANFNEFLWDINSKNIFGVTNGEWPRTQDLKNFKLITNGVFLAKKEQFAIGERIGKNPMLYELNEKESMDIDTSFDFEILKLMLQNNV